MTDNTLENFFYVCYDLSMETIHKFNDPSGRLSAEEKITFSVKNPPHLKYRSADVSFVFDPNHITLKRLDFLIDGQNLYVNLNPAYSRTSPTWFFQKRDSIQKLSEQEIELILTAASDVLKIQPLIPKAYRTIFELLPSQSKIFKKIFDKETSKQEQKELLKLLHSKNIKLQIVKTRYKRIKEKEQQDLLY